MSLVMWMYVISITSEVETLSCVVIWVTLLVAGITIPAYTILSDGFKVPISNGIKMYIKRFLLFILLPALVLVTVLPSKNEMYIMAGLHFGEKALKSEKGSEVLDKSYEALIANIEKSVAETLSEGK